MTSNGIWDTLEMHCASMGFKYEEYVDLHFKSPSPLGQVLSERGYNLVGQIFDNSYDEYCALNRSDHLDFGEVTSL